MQTVIRNISKEELNDIYSDSQKYLTDIPLIELYIIDRCHKIYVMSYKNTTTFVFTKYNHKIFMIEKQYVHFISEKKDKLSISKSKKEETNYFINTKIKQRKFSFDKKEVFSLFSIDFMQISKKEITISHCYDEAPIFIEWLLF